MKRAVFILLLNLTFVSSVFAAPHLNRSIAEPIEYPGLTLQERTARSIQQGMLLAAPTSYASPTSVSVLFLRVEFQQDTNPSVSRVSGSGLWEDYKYSGDSNYWVTRAQARFAEYWKEVSYGLLTVNVDVSSKVYKLPQTMVSYAGGTVSSIETIVYDSIVTASTDTTTTINFANYDGVFIVHAGIGQETDTTGSTPNDLWSLYYSGGNRICRNAGAAPCITTVLKDGRPLSEAIIMPQTDMRTGILVDALGVYVHEFGHWLGLPDLYCTASSCQIEGVGNWSLMDEGSYNADPTACSPRPTDCFRGSAPAHLDAWSLYKLGWVAPVTLDPAISDPTGTINLPAVETIPPPATGAAGTNVYKAQASTANPKQYFLIENRQKIGFDVGIPGSGLLVWLINEDIINAALSSNSVNNNASRPGVKLIEADGNFALQNAASHDYGSAGDPFPGSRNNTSLTPMTAPSTIPVTYYGWVNIRNITEASQVLSFSIGYAPLPPANLAQNNSLKTLSWTANSDSDFSEYLVYKNGALTPFAHVSSSTTPSYVDSAMSSSDVYMVTAVDVNGNESQSSVIAPIITVNPTSLTFNDTVTSGTVALSNAGSADLVIQSISVDSSDFRSTNNCSSTIIPNGSCNINVSFIPRSTGLKSGNLTITSNDPANTTIVVQLTGTQTQPSPAVTGGGGSSSGGISGCFIATAAFGSYLDPHVEVLRSFRDQYLITNAPGRALVMLYYQNSPPVADYISNHEGIRIIVRLLLIIVILAIQYPVILLVVTIAGLLLARRRYSIE